MHRVKYEPHYSTNNSHDNLVEYLEEIDHYSGLFTHLSDDDSKCDAEHNDACEDKHSVFIKYKEYCRPPVN